ncbi:kinase-like domain-containing protein, partial [Abortiporus biennis]
EALVWRQLKHPYILPFLGIDGDSFKPSLCLISPYMQNGNILRCMERLDELRADIPREPWLLEIARGLAYLHSENVVHADLRGVNILVDDDLHIRLSDFGLALVIDPSSTSYTCSYLGGSARWLAPEVLKETQPSFQSDIYAFGCVCVEIYTRLPPFPDLKDTQVVAQVIRGARPTRPRTGMQAYVWNVVRKCWKWDPQSRPNAEGI